VLLVALINIDSRDSVVRELEGLRKDPTYFCGLREISEFASSKFYGILAQGKPQRGVRVA
jgi:hypothetical protein